MNERDDLTDEQELSLDVLRRTLSDWEPGGEVFLLQIAVCGEVIFVLDSHGKREFTINRAGIVDQVM